MEAPCMTPIPRNTNTSPRPVALVPIPANIPPLLKDRPQWVLWRYAWKGKRWTKIPHQVNKHHASSTDAATWTTFATVWAAYQAGGWDGIGYVLISDEGLT